MTDIQKSTIKQFYNILKYDYFYALSEREKILPFTAHVLSNLSIENELWQSTHNLYLQRNIKIKECLSEFFLHLKQSNCKTVSVFENYGVLLRTGGCQGCFCSGDIDMTADLEEKQEIEKILNKCNFYKIIRRNDVSEKMTNYINKDLLKSGFYFNLMWQPVARKRLLIQDKYAKRLKKARGIASDINETNIRVLDVNNLMYFCILHIASSHFFTLPPGKRLYVDVDRLARNCEIDWEKIRMWAIEDEAGLRTDIVLSISEAILDTPIPAKAFTKGKLSKRYEMLMQCLYNKDKKDFKKHNTLSHKIYTEYMSDNKSLISNIMNRIKHGMKCSMNT